MQTKREYLVGLGLAKEGRGKFSNAAKEALAKAEASGMKFSDATGPAPVRPAAPKGEAKPAPSAASDSLYVSPSDFRFPEDDYKAVGTDGKTYSMRECCNNCRASLTNHSCDNPTIHGNMVVHIRERK